MSSLNRLRLMLANHVLNLAQTTDVTVDPAPEAGYEAVHLLNPSRSKICRVTGDTMTITFKMNGYPWVHGLFLTGIYYDPTTQFRLKGNSENDGWDDPDFDTGLQAAYVSSVPFGAGLFGDGGFGGYLTKATAPYYRPVLPYYFGALRTDPWYQLTITNAPGQATTGIGVVGLCTVTEMPRNYSVGWKLKPVDSTITRRSTSGDIKKGRPGTRRDDVILSFSHFPKLDFWSFQNALKTLGVASPFFMAMHPESGSGDEAWTTYYGSLEKLPNSISTRTGNHHIKNFKFTEATE